MEKYTQEQSRKRKRSSNSLDRISLLPEVIISLILSLLPTRDAVRTSVLSRDWEYKWTSITNFDIVEQESSRPFEKRTRRAFVNFVARVVLHTHKVTSLALNVIKIQETELFVDLISELLMRGVESLVLNLVCHDCFVFPQSLLNNTSLVNLEVHFQCVFSVPAYASFPNLKRLNLSDVDIYNDSSSDTLTLSLPVLETLVLYQCSFSGLKMMEIHAPVLTRFDRTYLQVLYIENEDQVLYIENEQDIPHYSIKIFSQQLVEFRLKDAANEVFIIVGQVACAALSYANDIEFAGYEEIGIHAQTLLSTGFSNVKELTISGHLTEVISKSIAGVSLPFFQQLVRLVVCNEDEDKYYTKGLLALLHAAPSVKFLKVDCYESYYDLTAVEHVPICVLVHLEEIEFKLAYSRRRRMGIRLNFLKFLLKNGSALKKLHVNRGGRKIPKDEITQRISAFPSSSTDLMVIVE